MIHLAASGFQSVKCSYAPVLVDDPVGSCIHHEGASARIASFVLVVDAVNGGFDRRISSGYITDIGDCQFGKKKLSSSDRYFLFNRDAYRNTPYLHVAVPVLTAAVGICFREAFLRSMDVINSNERRQRCLVGDLDVPVSFKAKCEHVVIPFCLTGQICRITNESVGPVFHRTIGEVSAQSQTLLVTQYFKVIGIKTGHDAILLDGCLVIVGFEHSECLTKSDTSTEFLRLGVVNPCRISTSVVLEPVRMGSGVHGNEITQTAYPYIGISRLGNLELRNNRLTEAFDDAGT